MPSLLSLTLKIGEGLIARCLRIPDRRGFTFVEIMLVVGILATISLALYSTLANGLKVWEKGVHALTEQDVLIFFDKLEEDLQSAFFSKSFQVQGDKDFFSFPTTVRISRQAKNESEIVYDTQPGRVKYSFDRNKRGRILRRQAGYGQMIREPDTSGRPLVEDIRAVEFQYLYFLRIGDVTQDSTVTQKDATEHLLNKFEPVQERKEMWTSRCLEKIPTAVRVTVKWGSKRSVQSLSKLILVPVGIGEEIKSSTGGI